MTICPLVRDPARFQQHRIISYQTSEVPWVFHYANQLLPWLFLIGKKDCSNQRLETIYNIRVISHQTSEVPWVFHYAYQLLQWLFLIGKKGCSKQWTSTPRHEILLVFNNTELFHTRHQKFLEFLIMHISYYNDCFWLVRKAIPINDHLPPSSWSC